MCVTKLNILGVILVKYLLHAVLAVAVDIPMAS